MTFYVPEHQLHLKSDKKSQSGREKYRHEALEEIILHTGIGEPGRRTGLRKFI